VGGGGWRAEQLVIAVEPLQAVLRLPCFGENVERDAERRLLNRDLHERVEPRHQVVQPRHVEPLVMPVLAEVAGRVSFEREHVEWLNLTARLANARLREVEVVFESKGQM
jgi:hypothetical protein